MNLIHCNIIENVLTNIHFNKELRIINSISIFRFCA